MQSKLCENTKQVLATLNSLGITDVTTSELDVFKKDLKLLAKINLKDLQQTSQLAKHKICNNYHYSADRIESVCKLMIFEKKKISESSVFNKLKGPHKVISEVNTMTNLNNSGHKIKKKTLSTATISSKVESQDSDQSKVISLLNSNINFNKYRCTSSEKTDFAVPLRNNPKLFIKSTNKRLSLLPSKKLNYNDPVNLYNKYTNIWDKLFLPGDKKNVVFNCTRQTKLVSST